ncbi:MAG: ACP S-malonyltransferase [Alphaproteobacteria bacterium]|nr:ACP S-malonyltransferase [Alphaproteobacteria bacterium]
MRAFVFPGQGSQFIGMGKALAENFAEAREVFEEVDNTLNQKLFALMTSGEEADLNLTENTQPALMAVSVAVWRTLQKQGGIDLSNAAKFVAGHSLGEYSALTVSGALQLTDTAKLLKLRGQAMQKAVPVGQGAMAAILGLDLPDVQNLTTEAMSKAGTEIVESANDNSPGQVVISGHKGAVAIAVELASTKGAKKAVTLPVSAPFHCRLMAPAAQQMSYALAETTIRPPQVPVICNVTAQAEDDPATLRRLLIEQITGMVRWRESIQYMKANGVNEIIELGAGKVLSGLAKRIEKEMTAQNAETPEQIEALITHLKG